MMYIIIYTLRAKTILAQLSQTKRCKGGSVAFIYTQVPVGRKSADDFAPFEVRRYGRHWEVRDPAGEVICLTVYRRGAVEIVRRLKLSHGKVNPESESTT